MKDPFPLALSDDDYFRGLGWAAVMRDSDGHAVGVHAPFETPDEREDYLEQAAQYGCTVTFL
jgi:hypothetical protein